MKNLLEWWKSQDGTSKRLWVILALSLLGTLIISAFVVMIFIYGFLFNTQPYVYSEDVIPPINSELCPGNEVQYSPTIQVLRNTTVRRIVSVWNNDTNEPADGQPNNITETNWKEGSVITPLYVYVLPDDIPPGNYSLLVSIFDRQRSNESVDFYEVPFNVLPPERCQI